MGLKSYVARRLFEAVPLVLGVIVINFFIIHAAPGDPVIWLVGEEGADIEYIEEMRKEFGLDKPLHVQLYIYLTNFIQGNLGYSLSFHAPVLYLILARAPATLLLMVTATIFAVLFGVVLGVAAARNPYRWIDNFSTLVSLAGYSMPLFWLGQMFILVFAVYLGFLPASGMQNLRLDLIGIDHLIDLLRHLVLPAVTLGVIQLAIITRLTRTKMLEELREDYIVTARAKGLSEMSVTFGHALKNALIPVVTVVGLTVGLMLSGAVLTETVFSWPGIGRLTYDALFARDYPLLLGIFSIVSISVVIVQIITDLVYAVLDPRIRYR